MGASSAIGGYVNRPPNISEITNEASTNQASTSKPIDIDNKRSLCAHPTTANTEIKTGQRNHSVNADAQTRLSECLTHNRPMVSFHSPRGFLKCKNLLDPYNNPAPDSDPKMPSTLQLVLQAEHAGKKLLIEHQGVKYTVAHSWTRVSEALHTQDTKNIPSITGSLLLSPTTPGHRQLKLDFIEFAPPFDGHALSSKTLLACHNQLKEFRQNIPTEQKEAKSGQFASAKGIGRSASLLIIDQFAEQLCKSGQGQNTRQLDVSSKVKSLINALRNNVGHLAINSNKQYDEVVKACEALYSKPQSTTNTSAPQAPLERFQQSDAPGYGVEETKEEIDAPSEHTFRFANLTRGSSNSPFIEGVRIASPMRSPSSSSSSNKSLDAESIAEQLSEPEVEMEIEEPYQPELGTSIQIQQATLRVSDNKPTKEQQQENAEKIKTILEELNNVEDLNNAQEALEEFLGVPEGSGRPAKEGDREFIKKNLGPISLEFRKPIIKPSWGVLTKFFENFVKTPAARKNIRLVSTFGDLLDIHRKISTTATHSAEFVDATGDRSFDISNYISRLMGSLKNKAKDHSNQAFQTTRSQLRNPELISWLNKQFGYNPLSPH